MIKFHKSIELHINYSVCRVYMFNQLMRYNHISVISVISGSIYTQLKIQSPKIELFVTSYDII